MLGKILIIGGSASCARNIIELYSKFSESVYVISRKKISYLDLQNVQFDECNFLDKNSRLKTINNYKHFQLLFNVVLFLPGAISAKPLAELVDSEIENMVKINLIGPVILMRDLLPLIDVDARVLFMSSISGERGSYDPVYAATKGALIPFAKSLAVWSKGKFTTNIIAPGAIEDTNMVAQMSEERRKLHREASPRGVLLTKLDLARVIIDLSHKHWAHSNGSVIRLNGGAYV